MSVGNQLWVPQLARRAPIPLPLENTPSPVVPSALPELRIGHTGVHQVNWDVREEPRFVEGAGPWGQPACTPVVSSLAIFTSVLDGCIVVTPSGPDNFVTAKDVIYAVHRAFQLALFLEALEATRPQESSALFWGGHEGLHVIARRSRWRWGGLYQDNRGDWVLNLEFAG
ncbi:hypothetical protein D9611_002850 [Ephemerocybe angulata]|uniref:DUF6699 domain-containing protein n=1 Tax=Ephemerocybe angulata TaxID=980116 RepID=A0A8H5C1X1_9AGAR|nr:hypothetical protein D9611_002850 [Tulosesus angulatus]